MSRVVTWDTLLIGYCVHNALYTLLVTYAGKPHLVEVHTVLHVIIIQICQPELRDRTNKGKCGTWATFEAPSCHHRPVGTCC